MLDVLVKISSIILAVTLSGSILIILLLAFYEAKNTAKNTKDN